MISFPANTEIVLFHNPVSFGCGIDGMSRYCRVLLNRDPMERGYFLFTNRSREQIRVLWYDGQGFLLCTKRLSSGKFNYWPKAGSSPELILRFFEAQIVLAGGDISKSNCGLEWKTIS